MNLLIVNDEVMTAETMKAEIPWSEYGIAQVFTAYDASQAKQLISREKIDILLCDIEMPGENGIVLYQWVKEQQEEIECIFLTCHASFEYAREAIELGCRNYLLIPAKYEEIGQEVHKVARLIRESQDARKYQEYGRQVIDAKVSYAVGQFGEKRSLAEIVRETIQYIVENLGSTTLSVNEIADRLHMHPVYLNRIFKKQKDVSIGRYIIMERMQMAGELLKSGSLSVTIVAEQVGYSSYPNFHMAFKKHFGCSPSQFQQKE